MTNNSKKRKTQPIELYDDCYRILMAYKEHLRAMGHNVRGENNYFESQLIVAVNSHWANVNASVSNVHPEVSVPVSYQQPIQQYVQQPQQQSERSSALTHEIRAMVLQEVQALGKSLYSEISSIKTSLSTNNRTQSHEIEVTQPRTAVSPVEHYPTETLSKTNHTLSKLSTTSFNTLFAEQFNGITVTDYHTVVNEGLSHNTNEVFYPVTPTKSNPSPDKPTYVMQQFIAEYNKDFRSVIINYIQNKTLVQQLSIDDSKLLNYIRTRYQRLGDMDTYIRLTSLTLSDLSLIEIEELLTPLQEHAFTITRDTKYSPMSNESRFKSAFQAEFDSAWKNDITEFTTI